MRYRAPTFKLTSFRVFFRVGLCSQTTLTCAGRVAAQQTSDSNRTAEIAWTQVHSINKLSTCIIPTLSDHDQRAYRSSRGSTRSAQSLSRLDHGFVGCRFIGQSRSSSRSSLIGQLTVDAPHDHNLLDRAIVTVPSPEALSDGYEVSRKNSTIAVRSNRDRGAIEPRSWLFHRGFTATISAHDLNSRRHDFIVDSLPRSQRMI